MNDAINVYFTCRPDLVDLRKVRAQTARQNLDMAFNLAEKEFGVTRLLDAEGKGALIQVALR